MIPGQWKRAIGAGIDGRAAAKGGNGGELRARDRARRRAAHALKSHGDVQPRDRADHEHPVDAGNREGR